jgi:hypothetical protein
MSTRPDSFYESIGFSNLKDDQPPYIITYAMANGSNNGGTYMTYCCTYQGTGIIAPPKTSNHPPAHSASPSTHVPGMRAIAPHPPQNASATMPVFTIADATAYVSQHVMPQTLNPTLPKVLKAAFLTDQALHAFVSDDAGLAPNALVCYVQVSGMFTIPTPNGGQESLRKGFEVFDAHTGNLLMWGGQP